MLYVVLIGWLNKLTLEEAWGNEPAEVEEAYEKYEMDQEGRKYTARQMCVSGMTPFYDDDEKVTALTRDGAMALTVFPVIKKNNKRFTLEEDLFDDLEDWQKWEVVNQQSIGVPKSWRSSLQEPDKKGIFYLEMKQGQNDKWTHEFDKGHFVYSKKRGLERKLS